MVSPQALAYVRLQLDAGFSKEQVTKALLDAGYSSSDVNDLFAAIEKSPQTPTASVAGADPWPRSTANVPTGTSSSRSLHVIPVVLAIVVVLAAGFAAAATYAYETGSPLLMQYMPFLSKAPYAKTDVLSGVALGLQRIRTSAWDVHMHVYTQQRDPGATPISLAGTSTENALQFITYVVPSNFDASLDVNGAAQKTATSADGEAAISFDLTSEDMSASFAAEFRKVGDDFYGIVTKIPGLFGDFSAIKGKWVVATPDDLKQLGSQYDIGASVPLSADAKQQQDLREMQKILEIEAKDHVLVSSDPKLVTLNGESLYEYDLTLDPNTLVPFYQDAMQAFSGDASSSITFDPSVLVYLKSDDGRQMARYLADNLTLTIWADPQGIPHKFELSLRVVPDNGVAALAGKQVRLSGDLTLSSINTPVSIEAPTSTISLDTAYQAVTGETLAQVAKDGRDTTRIEDLLKIQAALRKYHADHAAYPSSLQALQPKYLETLPVDPVSSSTYFYRASGSSYTLSANLEGTSSSLVDFGPGKLLKTSCEGAAVGYCYRVTPISALNF